MPLYDYKCATCGFTEEVLLTDAPNFLPCRVCEALAERQFPTGTSFGITGFTSRNGYSKSDEVFRPDKRHPDIMTKVVAS